MNQKNSFIPNKIIVFGSNFVTTLGLVRSLGQKGLRVILLLEPCDLQKCYIKYSRYIKKIHYLSDVKEGVDVLRRDYWNEREKPILLCGTDASMVLLDAHYDELKDHFFMFNAGAQGRINHFMDKFNSFSAAAESGFNLIPTLHVKSKCELPDDLHYPCLIKGNNSTTSTKADMHVCHNRDEIELGLREGVDYLVQEYIKKDFELDVIGFSYEHGDKVYIPAVVRKIRDSMSLQSAYFKLDSLGQYPDFDFDSIRRLVKNVGYEGIFSVELLHGNGRYYFLEINLRNDACAYVYTKAGANYPYLWVCYCEGKLSEDVFAATKVRTPFYLMQMTDVFNFKAGRISFLRWIWQAVTADAHFILSGDDMMPYWHSIWWFIKAVCGGIIVQCSRIIS